MEGYKTLWQLLQEVVEKENKRFSLYEFLEDSTKEERIKIKNDVVEADYKQFYEFMDGYHFVNETEVYMACCQYYEYVMDRPISMWECGDMSEVADDYIREKWLEFEDDLDVFNS